MKYKWTSDIRVFYFDPSNKGNFAYEVILRSYFAFTPPKINHISLPETQIYRSGLFFNVESQSEIQKRLDFLFSRKSLL